MVALLRSGMMGTASWASIISLIHFASVGEHEAIGRQLIIEQRPRKGAVMGLPWAQGEAKW